MAEHDDEGFLSRWSRLKRRPEEDRDNDPVAEQAEEAAAASLPVAEEFEADELPQRVLETPEEELSAAEREWLENRRRAEAVDLDTVAYEADFALFLKRGVPRALRKKALRKLWRSNPLLANLDGLNDYEEDFGDPALNTFTSIWQVGRGYLGGADSDDRPATVGGTNSVRDDAATREPGEADADGEVDRIVDIAETDEAETAGEVESESRDAGREPVAEAADDAAPQRVSPRRRWNLDNS